MHKYVRAWPTQWPTDMIFPLYERKCSRWSFHHYSHQHILAILWSERGWFASPCISPQTLNSIASGVLCKYRIKFIEIENSNQNILYSDPNPRIMLIWIGSHHTLWAPCSSLYVIRSISPHISFPSWDQAYICVHIRTF